MNQNKTNFNKDDEIRWDEKIKLAVTDAWLICVENYSIILSEKIYLEKYFASRKKEEIENDFKFSEEFRAFKTYYSEFFKNALATWTAIKFYLNIPDEERDKFNKEILKLNDELSIEDLEKTFDQLSKFVAVYIPEQIIHIDEEMRL